jgi:hypothetical protein
MKGRSRMARMALVVELLDDIIDPKELSTEEALDLMEEVQGEVENRIDGLQSDLEAQADS